MKRPINTAELRKLIDESCGFTPELIWIYGSCAIGLDHPQSDIDVICYDSSVFMPDRKSARFGDIPVSVNVFGDALINCTPLCINSGYYFPFRFLSPLQLLSGNLQKAAIIATRSFLLIIDLLMEVEAEPRDSSYTPEMLLSGLILLQCRINHSFLLYLIQWYRSEGFENYWQEKTKLISGLDIPKKTVFEERNPTTHSRQVHIQELAAHYWAFSVVFRNGDLGHISDYFSKNLNRLSLLPNREIADIISFLEKKAHKNSFLLHS